jgi:hypothetical protein
VSAVVVPAYCSQNDGRRAGHSVSPPTFLYCMQRKLLHNQRDLYGMADRARSCGHGDVVGARGCAGTRGHAVVAYQTASARAEGHQQKQQSNDGQRRFLFPAVFAACIPFSIAAEKEAGERKHEGITELKRERSSGPSQGCGRRGCGSIHHDGIGRIERCRCRRR